MRLLIAEYRKSAKMSVRDLAAASGVSRNHISRLENEGVDVLLSTLCKLAKALGTHPTNLVDWDEKIFWNGHIGGSTK